MTKPISPPAGDKVVAVGLLTRRDLDLLGAGFHRVFPVAEDADFSDLLQALEKIEAVPTPKHDRD